jgi:hypothetical protein
MNAPNSALQRLMDERDIYRLSCLYAAGADRGDPKIWESIMSPNMVLITPRIRIEGREEIIRALPKLSLTYTKTQHRVLNQLYDITGDVATGETYCVADHMTESVEGARTVSSWMIRYQDNLARIGGEWRFVERELIVDWIVSYLCASR